MLSVRNILEYCSCGMRGELKPREREKEIVMKTQFRKALMAATIAASLCGAAGGAAAAQSYSFDFGMLLSGTYQPTDTFASMSVASADDLTFTFNLTTYDLNSRFTSGAFISRALFNTASGADPISLSFLSGDVTGVSLTTNPAQVGSIGFDFGSVFPTSGSNGGAARLTANEQVSWSVTFGSVQTSLFADPAAALHVQGLTTGQGGSAWYTPTAPVPEPETYAMLMAGLGLVGAVVRRRKAQAST